MANKIITPDELKEELTKIYNGVEIPLDVLAQALIEQEALLCEQQGLKAGSVILEAYLKLEREGKNND